MDANKRILIVDDDPAIGELVVVTLRHAGFDARTVGSLEQARAALNEQPADLLILDLGLPDGDGVEFCRELRQESKLPVVMLTCRDSESDRVLGLESGADDYVVKPFSPKELSARIRSIFRRIEALTENAGDVSPIISGRLNIRPSEHRVLLGENEVTLTPTEFDLLKLLFESPERVLSRDQLVTQLYQGEVAVSARTVDSHIKGIRKKFAAIDSAADPIDTVYGVGYRAHAID